MLLLLKGKGRIIKLLYAAFCDMREVGYTRRASNARD
jgi:hypothetical protein